MFQHVEKDKILFEKKPRIDYLGIAEKEKWEHDALIAAAKSENIDLVKSKEEAARKAGKTIVWYCCEFVLGILEGAIDRGIRHDDFWSSFVKSFAGGDNYTRASQLAGIKENRNHYYSGYDCKGNGLIVFIKSYEAEPSFKKGLKMDVNEHLKRLENNNISLYYLESLMNDIQNSKQIPAFGGRDKYYREIRPFSLWLEKKADKIRAKLAQGKEIVSAPKENIEQIPMPSRTLKSSFNDLNTAAVSVGQIESEENYQLTPAEIEELEKRGFDREEIDSAEIFVCRFEGWLAQKFLTRDFKGCIQAFYFDKNDKTTIKGKGKLCLYIYPESEWEKIVEKQKEILEKQTGHWLQIIIIYFEVQLGIAKDKEGCVERKLKEVKDFVTNEESGAIFTFPTQYGFKYVGSADGFFSKKNDTAEWYQRIIVRGEFEAFTFIEAKHENSDALPYCIVVEVLYRFQIFLREKLATLQTKSSSPKIEKATKSKTLEALPTLNEVLRFPERLSDLWYFLTRKQEQGKGVSEFFDERGYIGSDKRNAAPLLGVAEGLRLSSQLRPGVSTTTVYKILCKQYNVEPSGEPHKSKKAAIFKDVREWVEDFFREN